MRIHVDHRFDCTPRELWELIHDPDFSALTDREARVEKTVLESRTEPDGRRYERLRFHYLDPLPGVVARVMGSDHLEYEQEQLWDDRELSLQWRVIPPIAPNRFRAEGSYRVLPDGSGCRRLIEGVVEVRVPLVGGRIEKGVVDTIARGYERGAELLRRELAARRARA